MSRMYRFRSTSRLEDRGDDIRLSREIYASIFQRPATLLRECNNCAFGFEEEEVLCVGDGEGLVSCFRAVGDFSSDCSDEDLPTISLYFKTAIESKRRTNV